MSRRTKRGIVVVLSVSAILGIAVSVGVSLRGDRALGGSTQDNAGPVITAVPAPFHAGAALGDELSGFSGRPQVRIFYETDAELADLAPKLSTPELASALAGFIGVLVDTRTEPEVDRAIREQAGAKVIIRSLQGAVLGVFANDFTVSDLTAQLRLLDASGLARSEASPLLARILAGPEVVGELEAKGFAQKAERAVDLLAILEGETHPAVQAARAELGR